MDNVKVLVNTVPGVQELHKSPPVNVAPTSCRSLDVQEDAGGNVCAVAVGNRKMLDTKRIIKGNKSCFPR